MAPRTALPKICIAMGFPDVEKLLQHVRKEASEGERFLEFRLDYLPKPVSPDKLSAKIGTWLSESADLVRSA